MGDSDGLVVAMAAINVDNISEEIMRALEIYKDITADDLRDAIKIVAKDSAELLQETSPEMTGEYAGNWSRRLNPDKNKDGFNMIVYNRKPSYRLSHLLEFGHAAVAGSFVSAQPHIKSVEEKAGVWIEEQLNKRLRG